MGRLSKLYLTEDFVEQLLSRLPPKSLMRFKCVCSLWCNKIKSPSFVAKHLSNYMGASSMSVLFKRPVLKDKDNKIIEPEREECLNGDDNVETQLSSLNLCNVSDDDYLLSTVVEDLKVPLPAPLKLKHSSDLIVAGHCDGILCLKLFIGNAILWNPAMKEFKLLPKSLLLLPNDEDELLFYELNCYTEYLGFGYDPKGKDYKVVRFVIFDEVCYWFKAEVYDMHSNSWRDIKMKTIYSEMTTYVTQRQSSHASVYFNGQCYWLVSGYQQHLPHDGFVLSFDMSHEQFNEISYPDLSDGCRVMTLAIWKEFIALLSNQEESRVAQSYDMWVMMDDLGDGMGSWTKHLSIGPVECVGYPLLFCNGEHLFMENNEGQIVLYNTGTKKLKYLPIQFMGYIFYNQALIYGNSIVSINGGNVPDEIYISAFYGSGKFQSCYRGEVDISTFHSNEKLEM
ncbi:F-box/kelch-repeat protein At3g23880-like [Argentina anserina]|uniref:F-box/kelch-repeat protein At3g23880-like n=1 Tax=Argentina anserina TaxID=57926 RepID=UPI0021762114|nr:F-box/kelch-repeat protein At3g23880-like [Potentilla anserina]